MGVTCSILSIHVVKWLSLFFAVFVLLASDLVLCLANVFEVMTVFRRLYSYESSTASKSCVCHLMAASVKATQF